MIGSPTTAFAIRSVNICLPKLHYYKKLDRAETTHNWRECATIDPIAVSSLVLRGKPWGKAKTRARVSLNRKI